MLVPRDPNDERDVILEVRAGAGGDEASLFAADLFRMYQRYADRRRWKIELLSTSESGSGGFKEVDRRGQRRGGLFEAEVRERRPPRPARARPPRPQGRIHTSTATVSVLPEADEVELEIPDKDLRIDVYRSSGPGGQSVNTTDSAVRVTHLPTGLWSPSRTRRASTRTAPRRCRSSALGCSSSSEQRQAEERGDVRRSQVGTRRALGEDPHLQLPRRSRSPTIGSGSRCTTCPACSRAISTGWSIRWRRPTRPSAWRGWAAMGQVETEAGGPTAARLLTSAAERLRRSGSPSPRLDAELLVSHAFSRDRAWLHGHADAELPAEAAVALAGWVSRREAGEPIAYIRGFKEWLSLRVRVDERGLIPATRDRAARRARDRRDCLAPDP